MVPAYTKSCSCPYLEFKIAYYCLKGTLISHQQDPKVTPLKSTPTS